MGSGCMITPLVMPLAPPTFFPTHLHALILSIQGLRFIATSRRFWKTWRISLFSLTFLISFRNYRLWTNSIKSIGAQALTTLTQSQTMSTMTSPQRLASAASPLHLLQQCRAKQKESSAPPHRIEWDPTRWITTQTRTHTMTTVITGQSYCTRSTHLLMTKNNSC